MVFAEVGNHDGVAPVAGAISINVFNDDSEAISILADAQWHSLPVDRGIFGGLGQQLNGNVDLNGIFEGLYDLAGQSGDAPEDIDRAAHDTVLVLEGDVAVLDLDSDGNQHGIAGDLHEVGPDVERHQVDADFVGNDFFQILELDRRSGLQLGKLFQTLKLIGLQVVAHWPLAELLDSAVGEAAGLVGHTHRLVEGKTGVGNILHGVFFRAVHGHMIVAAHAGVDELDEDLLTNALEITVTPGYERIGWGL